MRDFSGNYYVFHHIHIDSSFAGINQNVCSLNNILTLIDIK